MTWLVDPQFAQLAQIVELPKPGVRDAPAADAQSLQLPQAFEVSETCIADARAVQR